MDAVESEFKKTPQFQALLKDFTAKTIVMSAEKRTILEFLEPRVSRTMAENVTKSSQQFEVYFEEHFLSSTLLAVVRDKNSMSIGLLQDGGNARRKTVGLSLVLLSSMVSIWFDKSWVAVPYALLGLGVSAFLWKYFRKSDQPWMQAVVTEALKNFIHRK